jgi:hypothetical protein
VTEEESILVKPGSDADGELLLYDFFKHLTSLALVTLGGVLVLAEKANGANARPDMIVAVLVLISASGIAAFSGAGEIVRSRYTGSKPLAVLKIYRVAAPALLGVGVGMFLSLFAATLS